MLIESGKQWWVMAKFAACLDRDTEKRAINRIDEL
jgi:hypothetical protein